MFKKIISGICEVLAVLIVIGCSFGIGYYVGGRNAKPEEVVVEKEVEKIITLPGEVEKKVVTVEDVESKLTEMAELTTFSDEYTVTYGEDQTRYMLEKIAVPGTTNTIQIKCNGIVKVGYDMNEIKVKVDDDKIYIAIPEAKLNDNYVIWDSIECTEKNNVLNPIEFMQYEELIDTIKEMGLKDAEANGIYDKAEDNLKHVMNGFLSEFSDYEIIYM